MKLEFLYHPVKNIEEALMFYQEQLGFEEAWREGDHTIALRLPNSDVQLMIEDDEKELTAGGVFSVESVDAFFQKHRDQLHFVKEPVDIPPGRYAIYTDNSGNLIRIIDFSKE